jgi:hypothetical protein
MRLPPVTGGDSRPALNPADPFYFDTPVSRRVNFHSMRRAYGRALSAANVDMQTAMTLTSHADTKVHMGYVRELEAAKPVPAAALPVIDPGLARLLSPAVTFRPGNDSKSDAQVLVFPWERDTGSETGANKGRSITRDAVLSAGFANPGST